MIVILLIYLMHDEMIMIMRGNWNWEKREKLLRANDQKGSYIMDYNGEMIMQWLNDKW